MASGGIPCRFFGSSRGCWFGDRCKFVHDVEDSEGNISNKVGTIPKAQQIPRCRFYRTPKGCRHGDLCCYRHDDEDTRLDLEMKDIGNKIKGLSIHHKTANYESLEQEESSQRADCHETYENLIISCDNDINNNVEKGLESKEEHQASNEKDDDDRDSDDDKDKEDKEEGTEEEILDEYDLQKPDIKKATCGECSSVVLGDDAFEMLKDHYMEQFKKFRHSHLGFLQSNSMFEESTMCDVCDKAFACSKDLLRHTVDKSKHTDADGELHTLIIEEIVEAFCYRDTVHHDEERLTDELILTLFNDPIDSDDDSDDESDNNFMGAIPLGLLLIGSHGNGFHGNFIDDDDSDDGGMFGFSEDDCFELMCQGLKPWDPEAADVLAVLNGWM